MVAPNKRGQKGILEQTQKLRDEIFQEINIFAESQKTKKARGFFWTRRGRDAQQATNDTLRKEAANEAQASLAEVINDARKSLKLRDDKGLSDLINEYIAA